MPLLRGEIKPGVRLKARYITDMYDLLAGVISDTDVTLGRNLTVKGALSTVGSVSQVAPGPTNVPMTLYGAPGQSADLFDVRDSNGNLLYSINGGGTVTNPRMQGAQVNGLGPAVTGSGALVGQLGGTLNSPIINGAIFGGSATGGTISGAVIAASSVNTSTWNGGTIASTTLVAPTFSANQIGGIPVLPNGVAWSAMDADGVTARGLIWHDGTNQTVVQAGKADVVRFLNGAATIQFAHFAASGQYVQDTGGMSVPNGFVGAGAVISSVVGDLGANRGGNVGYVFLGNASHYIGFDGTYYQLPTSPLYAAGHRVVTEDEAETLTNKTLNSPALNSPTINSPSIGNPSIVGTVSGAPTWSSPQTLPTGSQIGPYLAVGSHPENADFVMDGGSTGIIVIPAGGAGNTAINFHRAFSAPPFVVCQVTSYSGGVSNSLSKMGLLNIHGIGTNGFFADLDNQTGSQQSVTFMWLAFGH